MTARLDRRGARLKGQLVGAGCHVLDQLGDRLPDLIRAAVERRLRVVRAADQYSYEQPLSVPLAGTVSAMSLPRCERALRRACQTDASDSYVDKLGGDHEQPSAVRVPPQVTIRPEAQPRPTVGWPRTGDQRHLRLLAWTRHPGTATRRDPSSGCSLCHDVAAVCSAESRHADNFGVPRTVRNT